MAFSKHSKVIISRMPKCNAIQTMELNKIGILTTVWILPAVWLLQ
uniref:Uncharacterized protein n=1 Tax=Anguilla anguilla TaxID=7936 RepID=A0A0E9T6G4_ANGAN